MHIYQVLLLAAADANISPAPDEPEHSTFERFPLGSATHPLAAVPVPWLLRLHAACVCEQPAAFHSHHSCPKQRCTLLGFHLC
jgi:hypothetical protein